MRKGRVNSFTKDILKDPEARKAVKNLEKQHQEFCDIIKKRFAHQKESKNNFASEGIYFFSSTPSIAIS